MQHPSALHRRLIPFLTILSLLFLPTFDTHAQQPKTITGTFYTTLSSQFTITFNPNGGPITFQTMPPGETVKGICNFAAMKEDTASGMFAGGVEGEVSGTMNSVPIAGIPDCEGVIHNGWSGTWSGKFTNTGQGSGTGTLIDSKDGTTYDIQWVAMYSAEEFKAALAAPITSEYIYNTYGIRMEDTLGTDPNTGRSWSAHELTLINDVLKELPPAFLKTLSLTKIIRGSIAVDDGVPKPYRNGTYIACEPTTDPDCASSSSIRIYDIALQPSPEFADGDTKFKAVILHELTHGAEYFQEKNSIYKNAYDSPLMINFMDAIRNDTSINAATAENGWVNMGALGWKYFGANGNQPPTDYSKTNPKEDLSESVKLYMYNPDKLKNSSMKRYNFIRDHIFAGVEYANGTQKK